MCKRNTFRVLQAAQTQHSSHISQQTANERSQAMEKWQVNLKISSLQTPNPEYPEPWWGWVVPNVELASPAVYCGGR